jgi:hypothetical protein
MHTAQSLLAVGEEERGDTVGGICTIKGRSKAKRGETDSNNFKQA